jgi:hypothetical protein
LRPTALKLASITQAAKPILTQLDQRAMRDALWFLENWALGMKARDALGHFVGADFSIDAAMLQSALDSFINNGGLLPSRDRGGRTRSSTAAARGARIPGAPAATAPGARAKGGAGLLQGLTALAPALGGTLSGVSSLANTTAANLKQVLGGLTGGGAPNQQGVAPPPPSSSPAGNAKRLLDYLFGP